MFYFSEFHHLFSPTNIVCGFVLLPQSDLHENLDILGSTTTASKQPNNKLENNGIVDSSKAFESTSNKIKELQEEVNRLAAELGKLKEMRDSERTTNERLESEVSDLKEKLKSKNDAAMEEREKKIRDLECQLKSAEEKYSKVSEESRREQGEFQKEKKNLNCMPKLFFNLI